MQTTHLQEIKQLIENAFDGLAVADSTILQKALAEFVALLDSGKVRAAECTEEGWQVNSWVKKGILLLFKTGTVGELSGTGSMQFFDKTNIPLKTFSLEQNIRIVPGGSSVRAGSFVAPGVVIMPPSFVNIGAYVEAGTMIDSHALVGSCAQIGKNVHLSAGVQIGGVLEPIGSLPIIIEDNVMIGGNCGVFEGTMVERDAVLGAGVILTRSTPVYDCIREEIYRATTEHPLRIPAGAVVIPGTRTINLGFAQQHQLAVQTPIIVKYRDAATEAATTLEEALR